ncbi:MAG TPA: hypothetical protein VGC52_11045 [Gemmatimonadaceae bacterium]|jgi:hypothetical protein
MYNDDEIELTLAERAALASLPREMETGDMLEARVVRALRDKGHFGEPPVRRRGSLQVMWRIAAALALFAGGVATGRYILAADVPESASISARASNDRNARDTTPRTETRPVRQNETVVAEREMWL